MKGLKIRSVKGRQILDSRGIPTLEAVVILDSGLCATASVPAGKSRGGAEAWEMRDMDLHNYNGRSVEYAANLLSTKVSEALGGMSILDLAAIDNALIALDGTKNKHRMGANTLLAASIACARAGAKACGLPLYRFLGGQSAVTLPVPMMNILNGGAHADNQLDVQEYMIMPVGAHSFREGMRMCCDVYTSLGKILGREKLSTCVGDEGGFAPNISEDKQALDLIIEGIIKAGYKPYHDFVLAIDAAASGWKCEAGYKQPKSGREFSSDSLIAYWEGLCQVYPIYSLEDGLDEEDWAGWSKLTLTLGDRVQIVGDDLFVTNTERLNTGIYSGAANAVLIKPNQTGTVTEAMNTLRHSKKHNYRTVVSHRSGETDDAFIADLSVALNAGQIKAGAPCRGERVAKYNRLLRIEESLTGAIYPGFACLGTFPVIHGA